MKPNPILHRAAGSATVDRAQAAVAAGLFPYFHSSSSPAAPLTTIEGHERVNLASNNYLGLAEDPRVVDAVCEATRRYGTGLTGSRLMNGTCELHEQLEELLCRFTGKEAALVCSTGYTANLAALTGLLVPGDIAVADSDVHASLLDGLNAAGADCRRFRHSHLGHLAARLRALEPGSPAICVVDGVYSMRGDTAPLAEIVDVAHRHGALVFDDEAHGLGVLGASGVGAAEAHGVLADVDLMSFTFSKSLASCGGAVVGPAAAIDAIRLQARPFVFTASNTPGALAAARRALELLIAHPHWPAEVLTAGRRLRGLLADRGVPANVTDSAIVTVDTGDELATLAAWQRVWDQGVFTNAVLPPAVPPGRGLLRLSVMRTHSDDHLAAAADAVAAIDIPVPA